MTSSPRSRPRVVALLVAALLVAGGAAALAGCERVSFWSSSQRADDQGGSGSSFVTSAAAGTGVTTGSGGVTPATPADVLAGTAACAVELYDRFRADAEALSTAAARAASTGAAEDRDAARAAWITAMGTWQEAEVLRVGPAGPATLPEGRSLRDEIYSWPLVSRCLVEQTLVSRAYEDGAFAEDSLVNVRGLAAAEYLLFYEGTDNACSASSTINASGAWAALSPAELTARKARYAAVVSADVAARARALAEAWSPSGGDFGAALSRAGRSGSPFESEQAAINAISDGLFYLEREVKDLKLGKPLGIVDCDADACLEDVESRFARRSVRHVERNLRGFERFFSGCSAGDDVGFDDLLATAGAPQLGLDMQASVAAAIAATEAVEEDDLAAAILADRPSALAVHAAVKRITDDLKTDFVSVLDLEPPAVIEGDND